MSQPNELFDAYYYDHCCADKVERNASWLNFFDSVASRIIADAGPGSVLDAGCGWGFLVERLRSRGIDAYGMDISDYAISQVHDEVRPYCQVGSMGDPLSRRYDLIVTIEVLEHMPAADGLRAVENICAHTDRVLFSSSPLDYAESTHFNVQPPEYWAALFARHGLYRDLDLDASYVTPWAVWFVRHSAAPWQLAAGYERLLWQRTQAANAQRAVNLQQRQTLAALEAENAALRLQPAQRAGSQPDSAVELALLKNHQAELEGTAGWALLTRLQRLRASLAPPGSRRDRVLDHLLRLTPARPLR